MYLLRLPLLGLFVCCLVVGSYAQTQKPISARLAPSLRRTFSQPLPANIQIQVTDTPTFDAWLAANLPHIRVKLTSFHNLLILHNLTSTDKEKLLTCPWVAYIDVPTRIPQEEKELEKLDLNINAISPVYARFPELTGQTMSVSVKENPFDSSDIDFKGRILRTRKAFAKPATEHATAMTTIIAGAGNTSPVSRGIAWQAHIASADFARLLPDSIQTLVATGVSVQNHSYGVPTVENYYGVEAAAYDQQCVENPWLLHVFSAGNNGTQTSTDGLYTGIASVANLTGQFKTSKNTLCIGAVDARKQPVVVSSRGPAYDGRIKPELVAYGESGTSEAAAFTSGTVLLVQQAYKNRFGVLPSAALVKAVLITSAEDVGRSEVDFETGYGNLNALRAIQVLKNGYFVQGKVGFKESRSVSLQIPAGVRTCKVTLVWHDVPAAAGAAKALVNDLDLDVTEVATGKKWLPWVLNAYPHPDSLRLPARRGIDRLNTIEQVTIDLPNAGMYTWTVYGTQMAGTQGFSVAYTFEKDFEWVTPVAGSALRSQSPNVIRWQYTGEAAFATLAYKKVGTTEWIPIQTAIPVTQAYAEWTPPATLNLASLQLRLSAGGFVAESDIFTVASPLQVQVGYHCDDKGLIYWHPEPNATQYQVFRLGKEFMEPFIQTTDTVFRIETQMNGSDLYAIAPMAGSQQGIRSIALDYQRQEMGCYVKNFTARRQVTDSVILDLELGTIIDLQTVVLERKEGEVWRAIQTWSPIPAVFLTWADLHPWPGLNSYRIRITTQDNHTAYSSIETAYYVPHQQVYVYPNPLNAGEILSVLLDTEAEVTLQVYDLRGQLLLDKQGRGYMQTLPIYGIQAGLYVLKVKEGNQIRTTKVMIR